MSSMVWTTWQILSRRFQADGKHMERRSQSLRILSIQLTSIRRRMKEKISSTYHKRTSEEIIVQLELPLRSCIVTKSFKVLRRQAHPWTKQETICQVTPIRQLWRQQLRKTILLCKRAAASIFKRAVLMRNVARADYSTRSHANHKPSIQIVGDQTISLMWYRILIPIVRIPNHSFKMRKKRVKKIATQVIIQRSRTQVKLTSLIENRHKMMLSHLSLMWTIRKMVLMMAMAMSWRNYVKTGSQKPRKRLIQCLRTYPQNSYKKAWKPVCQRSLVTIEVLQ